MKIKKLSFIKLIVLLMIGLTSISTIALRKLVKVMEANDIIEDPQYEDKDIDEN